MINTRVLMPTLILMAFIFIALTYVTNTERNKYLPGLRETGADAHESEMNEANDGSANSGRRYSPADTNAWSFKPTGSWSGFRTGKDENPVIIKFDRQHYWLLIKGNADGDILEKGTYEYQYNQIYFKPSNKRSYYMDSILISGNSLQLHGNGYTFILTRKNDIKIDFNDL
jgi:hypothetical protein